MDKNCLICKLKYGKRFLFVHEDYIEKTRICRNCLKYFYCFVCGRPSYMYDIQTISKTIHLKMPIHFTCREHVSDTQVDKIVSIVYPKKPCELDEFMLAADLTIKKTSKQDYVDNLVSWMTRKRKNSKETMFATTLWQNYLQSVWI